MQNLQRSKNYFLHASSKQTGANIDESRDPTAVERKKFMMELPKPKGKTCLSLGCGLGRFLRDYVKHGAQVVVGLDINPKNLEQCKEIGVDLVLGDIENMPFQDNIFDVIDCEATMEHIADPVKAMKEIRRINNQKLGISFVTWHVYRWLSFLTSRTIRLRLMLCIRDLIVNTAHIGRSIEKMRENRLLKVFSFSYGTYRNAGFSYPEIQQIYEEGKMRIDILKIYGHVVFVTSKKINAAI